jgi:hypothetical protein
MYKLYMKIYFKRLVSGNILHNYMYWKKENKKDYKDKKK